MTTHNIPAHVLNNNYNNYNSFKLFSSKFFKWDLVILSAFTQVQVSLHISHST